MRTHGDAYNPAESIRMLGLSPLTSRVFRYKTLSNVIFEKRVRLGVDP